MIPSPEPGRSAGADYGLREPNVAQSALHQHALAMFDIMGTTASLLAIGNPLDEGFDRDGARARWTQAASQVVSLQSNFRRFLSALSGQGSRFVDMDKRLVWQGFGDSVLASVPYKESATRFLDTFGLCLVCGEIVRGALDAKVPLQCALELGYANAHLLRGQIYGPALAEVHELLKKDARFPRVLVGQRLLGVLRDAAAPRIPDAGEDAEQWALSASQTLAILAEDEAGHTFVDYLGRGFRDALGEPAAPQIALYDVCVWAKHEEDRLRRQADFNTAYKYSEVVRYFTSRGYGERPIPAGK